MDVTETGSGGWKRHAVSFLIVAASAWLLYRHIDLGRVVSILVEADPLLYAGAFLLFYTPFLFRGVRWRVMLRNAGVDVSIRQSVEVIFLSFFMNAVIPAQLGDLYRAHLLKARSDADRSRMIGSVFVVRGIDFVVLLCLATVFGLFVFVTGFQEVFSYLRSGYIALAAVVSGLLLVYLARHATIIPANIRSIIHRFMDGVRTSVTVRTIPSIALWTALIWLFVVARFAILMLALGLSLPMTQIAFLAAFTILVTILPLTPGGLGVVELLSATVFAGIGVAPESILSIILLDRTVSMVSLIVSGFTVYQLTDRPVL